jgi:TonB family protein
MILVAAILVSMCEACAERAASPFGFPYASKQVHETPAQQTAPAPKSMMQAGDSAAIQPKMIKRIEPAYPFKALREGTEGRVVVRFQIAPDGVPFNMAIQSSSNPVFDEPVLRAFSQSRFEPEPAGMPIYGGRWFQQPYAFRFEDEAPAASGQP